MNIRKALFFLAILCLTTLIPSLHAQAASVPYTFTSGTTASAAQVNADFAALAKYLPAIGYSNISYSGTITSSTPWVTLGSKTVTFPANGYAVVSFSGVIDLLKMYSPLITFNFATSTSQTPSSGYQTINIYISSNTTTSGYTTTSFTHKIIIPVIAGNSTFYALYDLISPNGGMLAVGSNITGILEIEYFPNSL
jgi:hypothetical protein